MRPPENEPDSEETGSLHEREERDLLKRPDVPDDVKSEVDERLERSHEGDLDDEP